MTCLPLATIVNKVGIVNRLDFPDVFRSDACTLDCFKGFESLSVAGRFGYSHGVT